MIQFLGKITKVITVNMPNEKVEITLYEDDESGEGHNVNNEKNKVDSVEKRLDHDGFAIHTFKLPIDFQRIANSYKDGSQDKFHEYYINVKSTTDSKASSNVNLPNPDYTYPEQEIEEVVISVKAKEIGTDPLPETGRSVSVVKEVKIEGLLDAYFAKKEYTKQTGEDAGTVEYTFGSNGNKTSTDAEKEKIAKIIVGKSQITSLKNKKEYTTVEAIKTALTATVYNKDQKITIKTFKLGEDFKRVNSAPLEEKLYLVATTSMLDGKEATIIIKEKDGIIKGSAGAVLPVLEITEEQMEQKTNVGEVQGTEKTEFKGTVQDGLVKIPIHLRPKSDDELKQWKDKLAKGKQDGTYTYTFASQTALPNGSGDEIKRVAQAILTNATEGKRGNPKIETGKTAFADDIEKALVKEVYLAGQTISFPLYKKETEFLYLQAKAQGEKQHDKEFLKQDGAYFQIGGGKCPRCEEEITLKHIEDLYGVHANSTNFRKQIVEYLNMFINQRKNTDKPIHINTCLRKAHFFAQVGAETLGINTDWIVETDVIPYAPANIRNTAIFGDRSGILERRGQIESFCAERPQKKLLSFLYANEYGKGNGNGNEASGDGYKYRGRGLKQLTGRENYRKASLKLKEIFPEEYIDLEANPDKVKEAKYAVLSAIAYWENNEVWKVADEINVSSEDNIKKIRRTVNGATAGWKDAKKYFEKGIEVFRVNDCSPVESISSDGKWHDPVDNPQLCLYSQGGEVKKPWHGSFGPTIRDGVNKHTGMDLFAKPGTNVYACVKSKVVRSEINSSMFGQMIVLQVIDEGIDVIKSRRKNPFILKYAHKSEIESQNFDHNGPFYLVYAHLKERKVNINDIVDAGKVIGLTGTSGNNGIPFSTKNPHLHFEIMNVEKQAGLNKKCNPGVYLTYKDEDSLTPSDIAEQEDARKNSKFWKQ